MSEQLSLSEWDNLLSLWREKNDGGEGYAINVYDGHDFSAAVHMDDITGEDGSGWTILATSDQGQLLATSEDTNGITMICNANDPWGCCVSPLAEEILGL